MSTLTTKPIAADHVPSRRCYDCFRPRRDCFCDAIPRLDNQTEVLIVQHARERFHPFNTARIAYRALGNSQLLIGHTHEIAERLALKPRAGLLYPGPEAVLISDVPVERPPAQLGG